jgi:hypothetical protein
VKALAALKFRAKEYQPPSKGRYQQRFPENSTQKYHWTTQKEAKRVEGSKAQKA